MDNPRNIMLRGKKANHTHTHASKSQNIYAKVTFI